jgi:hypothetical protein
MVVLEVMVVLEIVTVYIRWGVLMCFVNMVLGWWI